MWPFFHNIRYSDSMKYIQHACIHYRHIHPFAGGKCRKTKDPLTFEVMGDQVKSYTSSFAGVSI